MKKWLSATLLIALLGSSAGSLAREVRVPLQLDNEFLRQVLVGQVYTGPNHTAPVWGDDNGCNSLVLSNPRVDGLAGQVRIISQGKAQIGTVLGDRCIPLLDWAGTIEVFQEPILGPQPAVVHFRTVKSNIYNFEGRKDPVTGKLWDQIKGYVHPRLAEVRVDLQPLIAELQGLLPLAFSRGSHTWIQESINSLALTEVRAIKGGIKVGLRFTLPDFHHTEAAADPEPVLSAEELQRWKAAWRHWDAFLTFVIKQVAAESRWQEFRLALLEILLEARQDMGQALTSAGAAASDPVRTFFLKTWRRLAPLLRQLSADLPSESALRYLSFIAASDALKILDQLGPQVDLEISADGLRRLARTLAPQERLDPLAYGFEVDPDLRQLFGFGPPLPLPREDLSFDLSDWLWRAAWAADKVDSALVARLNRWAPTASDLGVYLPLVHKLLDQTVDQLLYAHPLASQYQSLYRWLVLATAWQESCWRQFIKQGSTIKPLSSGGGSVGLMQVNPHVWRGFYDPKGLKQNIAYNAKAGGEILMHYLVDYAIKKGEYAKTGKIYNLARATYAAYNGGPGHLTRYRKASTPKSLRKIDASFWDKYQTIKQGNAMAVAQCFGVEVSSLGLLARLILRPRPERFQLIGKTFR